MTRTKRGPRTLWLARENDELGMYEYVLCRHKPTHSEYGWWLDSMLDHFCATEFERCTGIRMKPGEGPIKVRIHIEEV